MHTLLFQGELVITLLLPAIHSALKQGAVLRAFHSGAKLRIVRIEKDEKLIGYGEHLHIEDALVHAEEDVRVGHRPFKEVYGPIYPHYMIGSTFATSPLDSWILGGNSFSITWNERGFKVTLVSFQVTAMHDMAKIGHGNDIATALSNAWNSLEVMAT